MAEYSKDPNHMTLEEAAVYLQMESVKYTNDLIYTLFVNVIAFDEPK